MRKTIFVFTVLILSIKAFPQKSLETHAYVKYAVTFVNDTNNRATPFKTDIYTLLGKDMSLYTSVMPDAPKEEVGSNSQNFRMVRFSYNSANSPIAESFFYEYATNKLNVIGHHGEEYTAEVDPRPTDYKLTQETKEIGGYKAEKATIKWKGRDYDVWFTRELPITTGPWKFVGLPGLILEVKDKTGDVKIEYAGFDKFDAPRIVNLSMREPKKVKYEEFNKIKEQFRANMGNYLENMTNTSNARIVMRDASGKELSIEDLKENLKREQAENKKRNNNPLEF